MPAKSQQAIASSLFWLSYAALGVYVLAAFTPRIHLAPLPDWPFLALPVGCFWFGRGKFLTRTQLLFSIAFAVIVSGFGAVSLWGSWLVLLIVPAFLFLAVFLFFLLHVLVQRNKAQFS